MRGITNSYAVGGGAAAAESHADDTSTYDARAAAAANLAANIATARAAYITSSPAPEKMSKTMGGRNLAAMIVNITSESREESTFPLAFDTPKEILFCDNTTSAVDNSNFLRRLTSSGIKIGESRSIGRILQHSEALLVSLILNDLDSFIVNIREQTSHLTSPVSNITLSYHTEKSPCNSCYMLLTHLAKKLEDALKAELADISVSLSGSYDAQYSSKHDITIADPEEVEIFERFLSTTRFAKDELSTQSKNYVANHIKRTAMLCDADFATKLREVSSGSEFVNIIEEAKHAEAKHNIAPLRSISPVSIADPMHTAAEAASTPVRKISSKVCGSGYQSPSKSSSSKKETPRIIRSTKKTSAGSEAENPICLKLFHR
jgi:hypothetical protein